MKLASSRHSFRIFYGSESAFEPRVRLTKSRGLVCTEKPQNVKYIYWQINIHIYRSSIRWAIYLMNERVALVYIFLKDLDRYNITWTRERERERKLMCLVSLKALKRPDLPLIGSETRAKRVLKQNERDGRWLLVEIGKIRLHFHHSDQNP